VMDTRGHACRSIQLKVIIRRAALYGKARGFSACFSVDGLPGSKFHLDLRPVRFGRESGGSVCGFKRQALRRCETERAKRSNFQTTTASKRRLWPSRAVEFGGGHKIGHTFLRCTPPVRQFSWAQLPQLDFPAASSGYWKSWETGGVAKHSAEGKPNVR
jgi:hypothetical protein